MVNIPTVSAPQLNARLRRQGNRKLLDTEESDDDKKSTTNKVNRRNLQDRRRQNIRVAINRRGKGDRRQRHLFKRALNTKKNQTSKSKGSNINTTA